MRLGPPCTWTHVLQAKPPRPSGHQRCPVPEEASPGRMSAPASPRGKRPPLPLESQSCCLFTVSTGNCSVRCDSLSSGFYLWRIDVNLLRYFIKYGLGTGSGPQCPSPESCLPSALVRMPRGSLRSDASEVFPDGALHTHQTGHHLICLLGAGMFLGDASRPCGQTMDQVLPKVVPNPSGTGARAPAPLHWEVLQHLQERLFRNPLSPPQSELNPHVLWCLVP